MSWFKTSVYICNQNLRKWVTNYRIWVIFILVAIFTFDYTNEIIKFAYEVNHKVSPWMFPFLFSQKYMIRIIFMGIILLFCDAPFVDNTQPYIVIRAGRMNWNIGQIMYIAISSVIYFAFIILVTIVLNLRYMEMNFDWGKVIGTIGMTKVGDMISYKVLINAKILNFYTPLKAMILTGVLACFVAIFIGLLIYAINIITKSQVMGILMAILIVLIDTLTKYNAKVLWISPISWTNLNNIAIDKAANTPTLIYVFTAIFIAICTLVIIIYKVTKKNPIEIGFSNK